MPGDLGSLDVRFDRVSCILYDLLADVSKFHTVYLRNEWSHRALFR